MKTTLFIATILVLASCGSPNTSADKATNDTAESAEKPIINAPTVDVTNAQLAGIWEVKEIRTNPDVNGKEPGMMDKGIVFGFTEDGKFMTTSLGADYMRESLPNTSITYKIENGVIRSGNDNTVFNMQWGEEGIRVVKIGADELCLWYKSLGEEKNKYAYLVRLE